MLKITASTKFGVCWLSEVKNFILTPKEKKSQDNEKKPSNTDISTEVRKSKFKTFENRNLIILILIILILVILILSYLSN